MHDVMGISPAIYDQDITLPTFSRSVFIFVLTVSLFGYIPGLPYWLYNISTFITIPVFLIVLILVQRRAFTFNEIFFLFVFILSILLSYAFSPFPFSVAGFLRAIVPVCIYYLVRYLKVKKDAFFLNYVLFLLAASFLLAFYQFLFQPYYIISDGGEWIVAVEDLPVLLKRPVSYLGNANVFGVFNVICFVLVYFEYGLKLNKPVKALVLLMTFSNMILFSKSRTSMLAFFLIVLVYNIYKRNYKLLGIFVFFFICLLGYVVYNYEKFVFLDDLFRLSALSETENNSYTLRRNIGLFAYNLIMQRPVLGVGPGNELALMISTNAPHRGMESASLLLLIERGIIGYMIYLYILFSKFIFSKNFYAVLIGVIMISVDFTETVCVLPQITSFLAAYLAISRNQILNS